jgi:hypothetical protein
MEDRSLLSPLRRRDPVGRFLIGCRDWHLGVGALAVCVGALVACSSAVAAPTAPPAAPQYLFSIPSGSGSLIGPNDKHLTLRLSGARSYLTRFTNRPLRQAFVVANVNFAKRFKGYFATSKPNAVLTYTPRGSQIPVSIVLTIGQPRWNAKRHTWTFPATRIRKQPDNLPGFHLKPPFIRNPRSFNQATLFIDDSTWVVNGCFIEPLTYCFGANFSGADLTGADLSDAYLSGANLTRANLTDANLSGADLTRARLSGADLTGANLSGDANLAEANLSYANLTRANLTDADLTDASLIGANLTGTIFCDTAMPNGEINNSGCPS